MSDAQQDFLKQLSNLREQYLTRLPASLAHIRELAKKSVVAEQQTATLLELHQLLHKLAGSAGTFGLTSLGQQARQLEHDILDLQQRLPLSASSCRRLIEQVEQLVRTPLSLQQYQADTSNIADQQLHNDSLTLLVVTEDQALKQLLDQQLSAYGCRLVFVAWSAIEQTDQRLFHYEVVLLDVSGKDISHLHDNAAWVQTRAQQHLLPTLMIAENDDFERRVIAARLGFAGFVVKPFDVPRVVNQLMQLVIRRAAAAERVLIIEDDDDLAEHYQLVLQAAGMQVSRLNEPEKIVETVLSQRSELVLMDLYMPHYSGPELAGVLRQYPSCIGLPIVFLSGETDISRQLLAMGSGGDDFLTKPIADEHLVAAVRVRIERARYLNEQIMLDGLTGLLKHANIKEAAELEWHSAAQAQCPVAFIMVDIDFFKRVNDQYGHAVGDMVIASAAMLLRQRLRRDDRVGRYGGEEFFAVLVDCNAAQAKVILDDIRQRFEQLVFQHANGHFHCSLSGGCVDNFSHPDADAEELRKLADEALYQAKNSGRNRIVVG